MLTALRTILCAATLAATGLSIPFELSGQSGIPSRPKSIAEIASRTNDNSVVEPFLLQSPFQTVTGGRRVMLSFRGIGGVDTPFMKVGQNATCRYLGDSCMSGLVRVTPMDWYAYMWRSVKGKFWLCIVYNGGPSFRCFEAESAVSLTAPEKYGVLILDNQKYVSQLPLDLEALSPSTEKEGSEAANDVAACEERCTLTVRQLLGNTIREQLVDGSFIGLWTGSEKGDVMYLKLMSNGFGLMWRERQAKTTKTAVASYWMVVPRAGHTSLLCLTKEVAHANKEVATGTITVLEPDADGEADCTGISGKGATSFRHGQTTFVKAPTPHDKL